MPTVSAGINSDKMMMSSPSSSTRSPMMSSSTSLCWNQFGKNDDTVAFEFSKVTDDVFLDAADLALRPS
ncbi:hypothetical protein Fmac_018069 [Flemingia macrophylla]|uniref:Uncharacterized protein n=1 Tax=Flemingia macrophylla TaxID=520843 RepID=A0ABD1M3W6_9FABA